LASNEIAAPALSQSSNVALCVANVSAMTGNDSAALRMVDDLSHKRPQDTWFQAFYLPAIRARIEINHGNGAKAGCHGLNGQCRVTRVGHKWRAEMRLQYWDVVETHLETRTYHKPAVIYLLQRL
jgi:hypothetical protein